MPDAPIGPGTPGPEHPVGPLTRTQFVRYAGASGDLNPMHHDDTVARAGGFPSVFGHGMFTAGVVATYLESWIGRGNLRRYRCRFRTQVFPDDVLTIHSTVTAVTEPSTQSEERTAEIECTVVRQNGDIALRTWATAVLP